MQVLVDLFNDSLYGVLALLALGGAFFAILIWRRVAHTRFRNEQEQDEFLDEVARNLKAGNFEAVATACEGDRRALPQLALLAVLNRDAGYGKVRQMLIDRFQRDVLADLEYQLSWVGTFVKSAPMVGLLGTVMGMMGAFSKLSSGDKVDPKLLAEDISFALITTALGLSIAIPLVLFTASANIRIRKMEDLVTAGLARFLEIFKAALPPSSRER